MELTGFDASDTEFRRGRWFSSDGFSTQERDNMETQDRVDLNVEFFHGQNEELLFKTTLNDIQLEEVNTFRNILNGYLESPKYSQPQDTVRVISIEGQDDALLYLWSGHKIEVCAETTFEEMLSLIWVSAGLG
jgi:hypothetical protein